MVIKMWHHGGCAWSNGMFLTTASNVNFWTDLAYDSPSNQDPVWQACDTENAMSRALSQSRAVQS